MSEGAVRHGCQWSAGGGKGHYTKSISFINGFIEGAVPIVLEATARVPFEPGKGAFTVVDLGAADGGTTMSLMRETIGFVKQKYGQEQEIHVIYEDQPQNDFTSLFLRIHGIIPDPPTFLKDHRNVFVSACATEFFSQCLPSNSVHLACSFRSVHWLSTPQPSIPDVIQYALSGNADVRKGFAMQFKADWNTFLLMRTRELVTGGQLIIGAFYEDSKGQFVGNTHSTKYTPFRQLDIEWKRLQRDGRITEEEYAGATFQHYFATKEEFLTPLEDMESPAYKAGLRVRNVAEWIFRYPQLKDEETAISEKVAEFARQYTECVRTWSCNVFQSALSDSRSGEEKDAIVESIYEGLENESPVGHAVDQVILILHIEKV